MTRDVVAQIEIATDAKGEVFYRWNSETLLFECVVCGRTRLEEHGPACMMKELKGTIDLGRV